jgi:hypothetical protein
MFPKNFRVCGWHHADNFTIDEALRHKVVMAQLQELFFTIQNINFGTEY